MVPEAWLEIGLSDLVTFLKALMDHDKHWAFGILEALMRVGVELWLLRSCQVDANN